MQAGHIGSTLSQQGKVVVRGAFFSVFGTLHQHTLRIEHAITRLQRMTGQASGVCLFNTNKRASTSFREKGFIR